MYGKMFNKLQIQNNKSYHLTNLIKRLSSIALLGDKISNKFEKKNFQWFYCRITS